METATVSADPIQTTSVLPVSRKRSIDDVAEDIANKKPKYDWFIQLEGYDQYSGSETESVYSVQGRETDVVKDTSDTSSKYSSGSDVDLEVEFEIDSQNEEENGESTHGSYSSSDDMLAAAGAVAAFMCEQSDVEIWATDAEDSDSRASQESSPAGLTDFWTCIKCKSQNDSPLFPYCEKCYQMRKSSFESRPKSRRRRVLRRKTPAAEVVRKKQTLSQDSGFGDNFKSSLEFAASSESLKTASFDSSTSLKTASFDSSTSLKTASFDSSTSSEVFVAVKSLAVLCKEKIQEYKCKSIEKYPFIEYEFEVDRCLVDKGGHNSNGGGSGLSVGKAVGLEVGTRSGNPTNKGAGVDGEVDTEQKCIICYENPRNTVFIHSSQAHSSCCYKCARKVWTKTHRCPRCNCKALTFLKVY